MVKVQLPLLKASNMPKLVPMSSLIADIRAIAQFVLSVAGAGACSQKVIAKVTPHLFLAPNGIVSRMTVAGFPVSAR